MMGMEDQSHTLLYTAEEGVVAGDEYLTGLLGVASGDRLVCPRSSIVDFII